MTASLRAYLRLLENRSQLLRVRKEVDRRFELNAVVRKIQAGPNLPVLFEKVRDTRYPVVSNLFGNYGIIAELLGVEKNKVAARWTELTAAMNPIRDEHPAEADDWEEISPADIPKIVFSEKDAGPYLTASVIVARDPDSGVVNLSYHRMQIIGPDELRCRLSTSGDLYRIQQKMEKRGAPVPAVVAIGGLTDILYQQD